MGWKQFAARVLLLFTALAMQGLHAGCTLEPSGQEIANLVYIPSKAPVGGGDVAVIGTFNIISPKPKTATVKVVVIDADGKKVSEITVPLDDKTLQSSDTLAFGVDIDTTKKGRYTFQVLTVDSKGRESNRLDGTVTVTGLF